MRGNITAVSDVGRKVVSDKRRLNRDRPVTEALEFSSCTGKRVWLVCLFIRLSVCAASASFFLSFFRSGREVEERSATS